VLARPRDSPGDVAFDGHCTPLLSNYSNLVIWLQFQSGYRYHLEASNEIQDASYALFHIAAAMSPASCHMATRVSGQVVPRRNNKPSSADRRRFERRRVIYKSTLPRAWIPLVAAHEHDDNGL
jgi:hypothetical protein